MPKVKGRVLSFAPSGSEDVVGYRLYVVIAGSGLDYDSPHVDLGMRTSDIDLSTLEGMPTTDGRYDLGVTAIDDAGNESSMSMAYDIPLDFVAPDAPGMLVFADI